MTLGPIEVLVVGFPGNHFDGSIVPEIQSLIDRNIIAVIDGLLIRKDADGSVTVIEFEEKGLEPEAEAFSSIITAELEDLVSSDDVDEIAVGLEPNQSAAVLVFEHTWAKPFVDSIVHSGGVLLQDIRVPRMVVEELVAAVAATE